MAKTPKEAAAAEPVAVEPEKPGAFDLAAHKKRSEKAWSGKSAYQKLYDDAYEFAIPYRRPASRDGKGVDRVDRLFDNTAIVSTFRFAGQLQQDLFPPGQPFFVLKPGPISKIALKAKKSEMQEMARQLAEVSEVVQAFFLTGEFDNAVNEMCVDLAAGTAALMVLEGNSRVPIRFVCLPADEVAIEVGGYGETVAIFWKTKMTRRALKAAFPRGKFPEEFIRKDNSDPEEEIEIQQDFVLEPSSGRWKFLAHIAESKEPISTATHRTQRVAVPRYYRVPGEAYGRGPILLALPTIKTLNKAMELMLKSAAFQMLGIWAYRPGGGFNPDTADMRPGAFWAMTSTGGPLGADVQRMDMSAGKLDVAQLVTAELRLQVQTALHDDRLPEQGQTPRSAAEIMARMKRIASNYMGAFGRLVNEIIPVIVRAVIEIAYRRRLIARDIDIDTLLIKIDVLSPIASALRAEALSKIVEFMQLVIAIKGTPQALDLLIKTDEALTLVGTEIGVPPQLLLTETERKKLLKQLATAAAEVAAAQAAPAPAAGGGAPAAAAAAPAL
jgi:hypothetical protein